MNIAVITGASSGLGKVFSQKVIERYPTLDEIWLIARRKEKMQEIQNAYPYAKIRILPLNLTNLSSYETIQQRLKQSNPHVKVLINNAGFARNGKFEDMSESDILSIIHLNIMAMTMINHCFLPYMTHGSYEIITGSVSSFIPIPYQSVYSASKAYVQSFTRSLHEEEKKRGVNILLLCPGQMETEMNSKQETGKLSKLPFLNLEKVTVTALRKAEKGKAIYTPRIFYKGYRIFGKIVPTRLAVKLTSLE